MEEVIEKERSRHEDAMADLERKLRETFQVVSKSIIVILKEPTEFSLYIVNNFWSDFKVDSTHR